VTRFVDVAGTRTRVHEGGSGEQLVLVHGGQYGDNYSLDAWSRVVPDLERSFEVLAFDRLGQGHTDLPRGDDFTIEASLAHSVAAIEQLAQGPVHLVGHSRGAFAAARIALDRPDLVRSLVLVDSNTLAAEDPRFPSGAFYAGLAAETPPGPPTEASVRLEPERQSVDPAHVDEDFVAALLAVATRPAVQEAARRLRELGPTVWTPGLDRLRAATLEQIERDGLQAPTLVVWGANDPSAPLPLATSLFETVAAATARAELHVFARAGHYVFREHPEAFAALLRAFCG
jgi:pimeloyl-ACP methyl ester carboxylesterase